MDTHQAALILEDIGNLLELDGANVFKVKAYRDGAAAVGALQQELGAALGSGLVGNLPGIGKGLKADLAALAETGTTSQYESLKAKYPQNLRQMLKIPGLGPSKVRALYLGLGLASIADLQEAARSGKLAQLKGFGPKTADKILRNVEFYLGNRGKHLYLEAIALAQELQQALAATDGVLRCEIAGSLRRKREIVKDIDLVAASESPQAVLDAFTGSNLATEVTERGSTKAIIRLNCGISADLRVVSGQQFPYAWQHFTGSAEHNTLLRTRAKRMGFKSNEYGLFRDNDGSLVRCDTEEAVYSALNLAWIPPELREGDWEVAAAEERRLPELATAEAIKGTFHAHTSASDGHASLAAMVDEARRLGLSYLGISDHSRAAFYANGLDDDRLLAQHAAIDALNRSLSGFKVFKGIEADILRDGAIDLSSAGVASCDFVIASIHSRYGESQQELTDRICTALSDPCVTMLGHLSGRLLLEREPYAMDVDRVFACAAQHGVLIEINSYPNRLDIDWRLIRRAKAAGVRFCINPDAHSIRDLSNLPLGLGIARKGGLEAGDLLNSMSIGQIDGYLAARKCRV